MGAITSSTIVREDGTVERVEGPAERLAPHEFACVSFHYDYSPALLPPETPSNDGIWRYRHLLPVGEGSIRYPLAVGGSPLLGPPRLRERLGTPNLWIKDETRSPTGSNKDRATALVLELAIRRGVKVATAASTGNVAASLAVGGAAAGVEAVIFVPATVSEGKLTLMLLAGATVIKVEEGYEAAFLLSRAAAAAFGWYDRNTGINPVTMEGKKTVAFEIWEALGREVPDVVVVPVGDGPTLSAMAKGFRELMLCGAADRLPRIIGVQAEGCQPVKKAWECNGLIEPAPFHTIADGIAVGRPIAGALVLRDVRETGGAFMAVPDEALLSAIRTLASMAGIIAEPAAAASYAGLEVALESGLVDRDERIVILVTGTGIKTPQFLRPSGRAVKVQGTDLEELKEVLSAARG